MNLADLVDEDGLQQDEWSLERHRFGESGQLEVIGWSGKSGSNKYYILKCSVCSKDSELFGEGVFRSGKGSLSQGKLPCGCGKSMWSQSQYHTLCTQKAKELGYTFLGFAEEWKRVHTKIKMLCDQHGEWDSGIIINLINKGRGCPGCGGDATREAKIKPDNTMIQTFFDSGAFNQDTKFWRSGRLTKEGCAKYWHVSCPECGEVGESQSGSLQQGKRPCACPKHRQQECYINWVLDNDNPIAIKFGIANNSKRRVKEQNTKSACSVVQHQVYKFPTVVKCKAAERECKKTLQCGIILKRDMPDGYTETTSVLNLEKIQKIYLENGGVLVN